MASRIHVRFFHRLERGCSPGRPHGAKVPQIVLFLRRRRLRWRFLNVFIISPPIAVNGVPALVAFNQLGQIGCLLCPLDERVLEQLSGGRPFPRIPSQTKFYKVFERFTVIALQNGRGGSWESKITPSWDGCPSKEALRWPIQSQ